MTNGPIHSYRIGGKLIFFGSAIDVGQLLLLFGVKGRCVIVDTRVYVLTFVSDFCMTEYFKPHMWNLVCSLIEPQYYWVSTKTHPP